jgi:hypothetical protein
VSWSVFWNAARELGVHNIREYVELTQEDIPAVPQHALNRLKKTLRERDAALAGAPT